MTLEAILTSNEPPDTANKIDDALAQVAEQGEEAGEEADDACDEGVDDGVGCAEDGGEQLGDGLEEIRYRAGDGHFGGLMAGRVR